MEIHLRAAVMGVLVLYFLPDGIDGRVLFEDGFESHTYAPGTSLSPYSYFDVGWLTDEGSVYQEVANGELGDASYITVSDQPFERSTGKNPVVFLDQPKYFVFLRTPYTRDNGGPLSVRCRMTAVFYNGDKHPYGNAIIDPQDDLRTGCVALSTLDFTTGLAFTLILTNSGVWASYERLPTFGTGYRSFQQVKKVAVRRSGDVHDLYTTYSKEEGEVHYYVDKKHVHTVRRFGMLADDMTTVLTGAAGEYTEVEVGPLHYGFGTFSLLALGRPQDGANIGLVNLSTTDGVLSFPSSFAIEDSNVTGRLFGQGADFRVFQFDVYEGTGAATAILPSPTYCLALITILLYL